MKTIALFMLTALAALAQAPEPKLNCDETRFFVNGLVPYCEIRDASFTFAGGTLGVNNTGSGNITVQPWDGAEIVLRAQVLTGGETASLAEAVAGQVAVDTGSGSIVVGGPVNNTHQSWTLSLEIYLPREAGLSLSTVNGNVTVSGFKGDLTISVVNGNLTATNIQGAVQITSTNGNTTLTGITGDVSARGTNGIIRVTAAEWRGQTIDVKNVNGGIDITVPHETAAHVELSTVMGSVMTNVSHVDWASAGLGRKIRFDLNGGGPLLRGSLVNGYVKFKQAE